MSSHYKSRYGWKEDCFKERKHRCIIVLMIFSFGIFIMYAVRYNSIIRSEVLPKLTIPMELYINRSIPDTIGYGTINITSLQRLQSDLLFATGATGINSTQSRHMVVNLLPEILNSSTYGFSFNTNQRVNPNQEKFRRTHLMTISGNGRLGNTMFQFAALLSCAKRLNYTAFLPPDHMINKYFLIPRTSTMSLINLKIFGEKTYGKYDSDLETLDTSKNWSLAGYYQSWKYFYKDEELIRSSFKFRSSVYEPARQFVDSYRSGNRTIVGIHVRRGDMATQSADASGYSVAPISYIKKSMNYFREKYPGTYFIVVSDDIPWCKENLKEDNFTAFSSLMNPGTDMAVLSVCDHVIVTSGTFGWWGAWLTGGEVVYFKGYPKPDGRLEKYISREDYYPPQWIGLE